MAEDIKYTISVDSGQAVNETEKLNQKVGETGKATGTATVNFNQLRSSLGQAMVAVGGVAIGFEGVAQVLRKVQQEMELTLKIYDRAIKNYEDTKILIYRGRLEELREQYHKNQITAKEYTDQALALNAAIASTSINADIARTKDEIKKLSDQYTSFLTSALLGAGIDITGVFGDRMRALNTELASQEAKREEIVKAANAAILADVNNTENARYAKIAETARELAEVEYSAYWRGQQRIGLGQKTSLSKQMAAQYSFLQQKQNMLLQSANAEVTIQNQASNIITTDEYNRRTAMAAMALQYGQIVGDYAAQAATGQISAAQAFANATIDIMADMLTKQVMAWAVAQGAMGNFIAAGAAIAAISMIKGILKKEIGGSQQITPVSIVGGQIAAPTIPAPGGITGGTFGGGAGYVGRGAETSMAATQAVPATVYYNQSIVIHGNVMAEDFISRIRMASYDAMRMTGANIQHGGL